MQPYWDKLQQEAQKDFESYIDGGMSFESAVVHLLFRAVMILLMIGRLK